MKRIMTTFLFAAGLVLAVPLVASAQTPDGETPAVETVCDGASGAAFGLCIAYCEAMDCDDNLPEASLYACESVRRTFNRITGGDVPCEPQQTCSAVAGRGPVPMCAGSCTDPLELCVPGGLGGCACRGVGNGP